MRIFFFLCISLPFLKFIIYSFLAAAFWFEDPVEDEAIKALKAAAKAVDAELGKAVTPSAELKQAWPQIVKDTFKQFGNENQEEMAKVIADGPPTVTPSKDL